MDSSEGKSEMNTLLDTLWYFCYITFELVVLFIVITAIVEIILMYIPQDKISKKIEKAGFLGNVITAGFGVLTPFCACSTLPMTVGFLNAGVPFGATMSFLITRVRDNTRPNGWSANGHRLSGDPTGRLIV